MEEQVYTILGNWYILHSNASSPYLFLYYSYIRKKASSVHLFRHGILYTYTIVVLYTLQFSIIICLPRREGSLNSNWNWYTKFYNHIILFVCSKTLGTFTEFWLVGSKLAVSNLKTKLIFLNNGFIITSSVIISTYILHPFWNTVIVSDWLWRNKKN